MDVAAVLGGLGAVIALGWLLGTVVRHPAFERGITDWVVDHRTGALDTAAPSVSDLASPIVYWPVTLVVIALLRHRGPRVASTPLLALVGVRIVSSIVKDLVGKARPPAAMRLVGEHGYAFPSGHTITALAVWGGAALLVGAVTSGWRRHAVHAIGAAAVIAVGLSRIYLGVHWVTDVLAGWVLGAAWLAVVFQRIRFVRS